MLRVNLIHAIKDSVLRLVYLCVLIDIHIIDLRVTMFIISVIVNTFFSG